MNGPKFSIDAMCSILKRQGIKSSEYTDSTILYELTFEQLRNLYTDGFETGEINIESLRAEVASLKDSVAYWKQDSAAAWDKCEERRLEGVDLTQQLAAANGRMEYFKGIVQEIANFPPADDMDGTPDFAQSALDVVLSQSAKGE